MKKNLVNIIIGALFIVLGVIIFLENYFNIHIDIFFDGFWTLFIIIPFSIALVKTGPDAFNILGITFGILLLLAEQRIISYQFIGDLVLPVVLVVIGLNIMFYQVKEKRFKEKIKFGEGNDTGEIEKATAIFSNSKLSFQDRPFFGGKFFTLFGGIDLDLRGSEICDDVLINVTSIFSGAKIILPDDIEVVIKGSPIFGGIDNKHRNIQSEKKVYISVVCMFASVDII